MKTQPATGETYPKSDLFNKADSLANFSTEDMTNEEIAERLGIAPDWMETVDPSKLT
nr:hypothetical protein [Escherichia coli]